MSKSSFEEVIKSLKEDENITLVNLSGKINSNEQLKELLEFFKTAYMNENFSGANGNQLTLDLSNNNIDDDGAQILASILKTPYNGIESVNLTNNPQITEIGYKALAKAIKGNNDITNFRVNEISGNKNSFKQITKIRNYLLRNLNGKNNTQIGLLYNKELDSINSMLENIELGHKEGQDVEMEDYTKKRGFSKVSEGFEGEKLQPKKRRLDAKEGHSFVKSLENSGYNTPEVKMSDDSSNEENKADKRTKHFNKNNNNINQRF